jgi:hypothetical protein
MKVWRVTSALDKDTGSPTTCAEGKRSQERGWHLGIMTERARTEGTEDTEVFDTVEDDVGNGHRHRYTRQLSVSRKAERILA